MYPGTRRNDAPLPPQRLGLEKERNYEVLNWDNIPEAFSYLEGNTRFLQLQTQHLHIYILSQKLIEGAIEFIL
ncbi:hypothetical protein GCK32_021966, partial [Trichostrongylus colubriformis]